MPPSARYLRRFALVYLLFGIAYHITECAYFGYRGGAGNPSDLPCGGLLWTPVILAFWPVYSMLNLTEGKAVLLSPILVRACGFVFVGGFLAVMWLLRDRPAKP